MKIILEKIYLIFVNGVWILSYLTFHQILRIIYRVKYHIDPSFLIEADKPVIFISNHKSVFDNWLLTCVLPFKIYIKLLPIRILGAKTFSDNTSILLDRIGLIKLVYFIFGVISIDKKWSFEEKTLPLIKAIKKGQSVFLFPEGHLNRKDGIDPFKRGVPYLYSRTLVPIAPCSIKFNKESGSCKVSIGNLIKIPHSILKKDNYENSFYEESCNFLHRKVESLYNK